jgi:hypothetical protein
MLACALIHACVHICIHWIWNKMLRRIFGPKMTLLKSGKYYIMRSSIIYTLSADIRLTKWSTRYLGNEALMWWMWHVGRNFIQKSFRRNHIGDLGIDKGKVVPVMWRHGGGNWMWVISFIPQSLYPHGDCLQFLLDKKLVGFQSWSWCCGKVTCPCA